MRTTITFRFLAVSLFLTFVLAFVSYHAGIIRADDLLFGDQDSVKPRAISKARLDSLIKITPPSRYDAMTSKSGAIFRANSSLDSFLINDTTPVRDTN